MSGPVGTTPRRRIGSRALAVLTVAAGAGLTVLATGRTWVSVRVPGLPGDGVVRADGRLAAPGAVAIALVALAGAVVIATSGRIARTVVAVLLVAAGLGIGGLTVAVWQSPRDAATPAVSAATGTVGQAGAGAVDVTVWPAVSALGGLLVAAGGAVALARGRRWPGPARRFERGAAPAPTAGGASMAVAASERDRRMDDWDRLTAGDDPTDLGSTVPPETHEPAEAQEPVDDGP